LEVFGSNTLTNSGSTILRGAIYLQGPLYVASSVTGAQGTVVNTTSLVSTTFGLQTSGFISSTNLTSTVSGLSNIVVTKLIAGTNITLTPGNGQGEVTIDAAGGGVGGITTGNLVSTTFGLQTSGFLSTPNLLGLVSTANLINLISTTNLTSSMAGLSNIVVTKLVAGSNITLTPANGQGEVTIDAAGGGGGGITTANLTSTVTGLEIFALKANVVVSTLGAVDSQLYSYDIGKYFLFTTTTAGLRVDLPAVENGWNAVIKNMEGSTENFTVNTTTTAILAPGVVTTVVCDGISFYSL
jgi:hypothetical protein